MPTQFELVTPDRLLYSQEVELVIVPGEEGDFGVTQQHSPLVSNLRPGPVALFEKGREAGLSGYFFVSGGFAEVSEDRCVLIAEEAFSLADVNEKEVGERLKTASKALQKAESEGEKARAEAGVAVAEALQKAVSKESLVYG